MPDNSRIDVLLDETHIATLDVMNKKTKLDTEDNLDIGVPSVKPGRKLRIKLGETVLAEGQYMEE